MFDIFSNLHPRNSRFPEAQLDTETFRVQGFYKWELRREGKVIRDSGGWHRNLITNTGMDRLADDPFTFMNQAKVGTNPAAPLVTDAGCGTPIGPFVVFDTETGVAYVAGPPEYLRKTRTYKWLEAQANGNLTEFAMHMVSGGIPCFAHQLLKDALGNPTVVVKTNLDQLFITYEWRVYPPAADVNSVVSISAVNYDVTARPCNVSSVSEGWSKIVVNGPSDANGGIRSNSGEPNALVARNAQPSVGNIFNTDATDLTRTLYVAGNWYVEHKCVWDIGVANYATGIGLIAHHAGGSSVNPVGAVYQFVFPTLKIPKTNVKKLTLFIRKSWARFP